MSRFRTAYEQLLPEIEAIPHSEWLGVNTDMHQGAVTVLRALPALHRLRRDIVRLLPGFDLGWYDKLETIALAVLHAESVYRAAITPKADLAEPALVSLVFAERSQPTVSEIVQNRHRAFTLLVWAYEHARYAVATLWPQDVDRVVPPLSAQLDCGANDSVSAGLPSPPLPTPAPTTAVSGMASSARPETSSPTKG